MIEVAVVDVETGQAFSTLVNPEKRMKIWRGTGEEEGGAGQGGGRVVRAEGKGGPNPSTLKPTALSPIALDSKPQGNAECW